MIILGATRNRFQLSRVNPLVCIVLSRRMYLKQFFAELCSDLVVELNVFRPKRLVAFFFFFL